MGRNVTAPTLLYPEGRNVKRLLALLLNHIVAEHAVLADHRFRDHVREIDLSAERNVILNNDRLAVFIQDDQVARVGHDRFASCRRHVQHADRLFNHPSPRDMHKCAVFHEGGIQGGKGVMMILGVPGEVLLQHIPVILECLGKTPHRDPVAGRPWRRKRRCVSTVHEDELDVSQSRSRELCYLAGCQFDVDVAGEFEGCLGDRRHVRESPIFIAGRREAQVGEAGDRSLADRAQPLLPTNGLLEPDETLQVTVFFLCHGIHRVLDLSRIPLAYRAAPAPSSTQA